MSKLIAVTYIFSIFFWIAGFYRIKKTDIELNGICFGFMSIFTFMCYQVFFALFFKIFHIQNGNSSFAILNILVGMCFWYIVLRKKRVQNYHYHIKDILAIIIFIIIVFYVSFLQFGRNFDCFNYECTWDCSVHLQSAREVASLHKLNGMHFMSLNMGLWLESFYAFDPFNTGCTLFIHTDMAMLFLCAGLFWTLIRDKLQGKYMYALGLIFTIAYLCGYPLNNMAYGTSYLGAGSTCVIYLMIVMELFAHEKIGKILFSILLCIGAYSSLVSYVLFMPVILGSIFLYLIYTFYKKGILYPAIIRRLCIVSGLIFILIGILFYSIFGHSMYVLKMEGQIYRNFITNFVFFLPFFLLIFKKKAEFINFMLPVTLVYIFIFLAGVLTGKISGYYYFKNYYVLWILCFYSVVVALEHFNDQHVFINAYLTVWIFMALFCFSGIKDKMNLYTDEWYGIVLGSSDFNCLFDLYKHNWSAMESVFLDSETRDLFLKSADMNINQKGSTYFVGSQDYALPKQFFAIANQPDVDYFTSTPDECIQMIKENCGYVCVIDPQNAPLDITEYLSTLPVVYKNNKGYIAEVAK